MAEETNIAALPETIQTFPKTFPKRRNFITESPRFLWVMACITLANSALGFWYVDRGSSTRHALIWLAAAAIFAVLAKRRERLERRTTDIASHVKGNA